MGRWWNRGLSIRKVRKANSTRSHRKSCGFAKPDWTLDVESRGNDNRDTSNDNRQSTLVQNGLSENTSVVQKFANKTFLDTRSSKGWLATAKVNRDSLHLVVLVPHKVGLSPKTSFKYRHFFAYGDNSFKASCTNDWRMKPAIGRRLVALWPMLRWWIWPRGSLVAGSKTYICANVGL